MGSPGCRSPQARRSPRREAFLRLSEDYAFCYRWRAAGGTVWADLPSRVTHSGTLTVAGDVAQTLRTAARLVSDGSAPDGRRAWAPPLVPARPSRPSTAANLRCVAPRQTRRARAQRRRTRRVAAANNDLTAAQWALLLETWGCCAYCRTSEAALQRDCVLPISRGGRYTLDNVVPACRTCNASKRNHEVTSWMRRRRLDERAFLSRWVATVRELGGRPTRVQRAEP